MATIHPINSNPAILAELEMLMPKVAVKTPSGKVVMLKKPNFKRGNRKCK